MILAIDPGIRGSGCALFHASGELAHAQYVRNPVREGNDPTACLGMGIAIIVWAHAAPCNPSGAAVPTFVQRVVFEWPRILKEEHKLKQTDHNDLLPLVGVGMAVCARLHKAAHERVYPDEWKRQLSKEHTAARILGYGVGDDYRPGRLSPAEIERIVRVGAKDHNAIDAVGIGLHVLGRFERHRVIAR